MTSALDTPSAGAVPEVVAALRDWQHEGGPVQLHSGDVGWLWRLGAATVMTALRTWRRGGELVAVGMLDGPTVLRLAVSPEAIHDVELVRVVTADIVDPDRGVLPAGRAAVEARGWVALDEKLADVGWQSGESWTPLHCDLADGIEVPATVRVETATGEQAAARTAVHRAGFPDHRGRGYGRAITLAGVAALSALGASSTTVCTPSANVAGVAAYEAAGFTRRPESRDRTRA